MPLYRVVDTQTALIGNVIQPGAHGAYYRQLKKGATFPPPNLAMFMWEVALETARLSVGPHLPSRFDCLFLFETPGDAYAFRQLRRTAAHSIAIVEPTLQNAPVHRADADLLNTFDGPWVDIMAARSKAYWTEPPKGAVEILLASPVKIVGIV